MADTITVTVRSSGGDYTSLSAAEAGEQRDLVTADEIALFDLGDVEDTSRCTIAGWTTDATRYVIIRGATPTSATWDTSRYRMVLGSGDALIVISQDYTRVENLQTRNTDHSWATPGGIGVSVPNARITGCWIENACSSGFGLDQGRGIDGGTQSSGLRVYANNIIVGRWSRGIHVRGSDVAATAVVYHNTIAGPQVGQAFQVTRDSGSIPVRLFNNLAQVSGTAECFVTDAESGGNLSSDATSPQTALRNITINFAGAGDYALDPDEDTEAIGAGTDLSGDGTYAVTVDYLGTTRPDPPSIGAYEPAGGGEEPETYNESLSLAAAAALAPSGTLVMSATQALSASAALAPSAALVIGATVALAADAAITTPSQAALVGAVALPAAATITPTSTAALVATLALQGTGGLGLTAQATLGASLALPAEAALGVVSQATVDAALALVASGTLTPAGAVVAQAVLALGLEAGYVTSAQIVGAPETHDETLALAATAGLELQATGLLGAVQAFAAAAGLTQDGATVIGRALALAVEADLTTAAQGVLRPTLALPVDATLTSQAQAQLVALLTLSAAAVLAQAAQLQGVITYDVLRVAAETLRAAAVTHETLRAARALDETLH